MILDDFTLISGPCVLEDNDLNIEIGNQLAIFSSTLNIPIVFKASFDKANRSLPGSPRGPGLKNGIRLLENVKNETGLPILTDIHKVEQAEAIAEIADIIQIPAFLCRQTDLLVAAGDTGKAVNVKKGQWMSPDDMRGAVEKIKNAGASLVTVTERGSFFGYGDLIVDMRSFQRIRNVCTAPVIFDGTHSLQRPGQDHGSSGGTPEFIFPLVRAAVAAGCDGLFLETHPNPNQAPSDSTSMLPLDHMKDLLDEVLAIRSVFTYTHSGL